MPFTELGPPKTGVDLPEPLGEVMMKLWKSRCLMYGITRWWLQIYDVLFNPEPWGNDPI